MRAFLPFCIIALTLALSPILRAQAKPLPNYTDAQAGEHAGEEAAVTGKVTGVSKTKTGTTFLNIGAPFPNQTFSGVVFAGELEKVGDLQQYDGQIVTLTGRIAMSPQGKPQIVIKDAGQIRLGEPSPTPTTSPTPAPMPAAPTAPPPASAPVAALRTPPPAATAPAGENRKIALAPNWDSAPQTGAMTRKDLALLFTGQGSSGEAAGNDADIVVYGSITYLTPLLEARKRLKLDTSAAAKSRVTCPGLPAGSFAAHAFSGIFEGGFNRLILVTDNADQVVSALVLDENSRQRTPNETDATGYHTYNFIQNRVKGTADLVIKHEIVPSKGRVVVVDTMLIDPNDEVKPPPRASGSRSTTTRSSSSSRTGKVLERSRWYVPSPVVDLILRCVGSSR